MQFFRAHSIVDVNIESFEQEHFRAMANGRREKFFDGNGAQLFGEFFFCLRSPWSLSSEHFVKNDSKSP